MIFAGTEHYRERASKRGETAFRRIYVSDVLALCDHIDHLHAELQRKDDAYTALHQEYTGCEEENKILTAELQRKDEALKFYADEDLYCRPIEDGMHGGITMYSEAEKDSGKCARAARAEVPKQVEEK